jgi:hypothetical protein
MGKHLLSELEIEGRDKVLGIYPDFDFYHIKRVRSIGIDFIDGTDAPQPILIMTADYRVESQSYILTIFFDRIRELSLPEMSPFMSLSELEIVDIHDRQLEGVRYEVVSQFDRSFRCLCQNVIIVDFEPAP